VWHLWAICGVDFLQVESGAEGHFSSDSVVLIFDRFWKFQPLGRKLGTKQKNSGQSKRRPVKFVSLLVFNILCSGFVTTPTTIAFTKILL